MVSKSYQKVLVLRDMLMAMSPDQFWQYRFVPNVGVIPDGLTELVQVVRATPS
jgi:hypothetical protein